MINSKAEAIKKIVELAEDLCNIQPGGQAGFASSVAKRYDYMMAHIKHSDGTALAPHEAAMYVINDWTTQVCSPTKDGVMVVALDKEGISQLQQYLKKMGHEKARTEDLAADSLEGFVREYYASMGVNSHPSVVKSMAKKLAEGGRL
ncbi:MAG: hypothetical protein LBL84_03620 [Candidatus Nomurabacteria bacterium]|jgi:hypothetical protein|nr:hypothetical protein [Candidatus Nomurabacteria bacterium]